VGAWVIYDIYWDPHAAYANKAEAEAQCRPGAPFAECHVLWAEDADPGDISRLPPDAFNDFLAHFEKDRANRDE
jgi:hypothetical protein